ncbi:uncharacterized protein LOC117333359 [Pecten maximus]|uniref:uncharacterized protein LOC117333359 n=1 Tax=Pecten maximus TaxID=6579 RepID=UPI001458BE9C|nr:uncharacterized protein LOC117333359 [Pecten maximus]
MRNNVNNGRHMLCAVVDILSDTWAAENCYDTNPVLCEFEQGKRKTGLSGQGRSLETSSLSTFSTRFVTGLSSLSTHGDILRSLSRDVRTSEPHLPNKRRKRSRSAGTREHVTEDNSVKSKRKINTNQKNSSILFSKQSNNEMRTEHKESETLLHSLDGVLTNLSDNLDATNIPFSDSTELNKYEDNTTTSSTATPNTAHVAIGILGIIVFVILICGLFTNDLKSMMLHIVRDEEGRANRENHALYHPHLTVHANYLNEHSSTQTLSETQERLSFKD